MDDAKEPKFCGKAFDSWMPCTRVRCKYLEMRCREADLPDNCGMTDVHFYFNVPDKLALACRLARKAFMQDAPMVLTADATQLGQLDQMLWQMAPSDFLAHDYVAEDQAGGLLAPIQLRQTIAANSLMQSSARSATLLLTLWEEVPAAFSHFERVYELVSAHDDADREHARKRWRFYQQRGYAIHRHDLAQKGG